jgi:DNA polymerase-3 subunit alpha
MAASLTLETGNTDKIAEFRREAIRLGIKVEPPSVNTSGVTFDVEDGRILYALAAIKGVGQQAVEHIVALRKERPFADLADFAGRINPRIVNKRTLESLIAAGALDTLEPDRARLMSGVDRIIGTASRAADSAAAGQNELFGGPRDRQPLLLPVTEPWLPAERLQREHDAIGFYLSAHPLDEYGQILERLRVQGWAQFSEAVRNGGVTAGRLAGTVTQKQERRTKSGGRMGIVQLSDPSGAYEAILFSETLNEFRDLLEPGQSVVVMVAAEDRPEGISVRINQVEPLDRALKGLTRLRVFLKDQKPLALIGQKLAKKGEGDVSLVLSLDEGNREVEVKLPGRFAVTPGVASAIRAVPGVEQVELV